MVFFMWELSELFCLYGHLAWPADRLVKIEQRQKCAKSSQNSTTTQIIWMTRIGENRLHYVNRKDILKIAMEAFVLPPLPPPQTQQSNTLINLIRHLSNSK